MMDATKPYVEWLELTAAQAEHAAVQARSAAIAANRRQFVSLVATNFLGQNAPKVAAIEAHYGDVCTQDAAAMYGYASSSSTAAQLNPFTPPAVELAHEAAQAREPAGTSAPTTTLPLIATDPQLYYAVPTMLRRLASPTPSSAASPQWTLNCVDDPVSWGMSGLGSSMSTISALISTMTAADQTGGVAGKDVRALGRPVSVRAWFGGSRAAWISRLGGPAGWRGEPVTREQIGPVATIGKLSVPHTWMAHAPLSPAAVAALPRTRSSATTELAAAAARREGPQYRAPRPTP